jgi:DNA-binding response OmpR family regulator
MPGKKKVLIADDERQVADLITQALAEEGYDTAEVTQALRFYDTVLEHKPDLILLDLLMPYLEGEDELRLLQMNKETQRIPVIVVTAVPDARQQLARLKPLGVVEIVQKPFNLDKLLDLVHKTID